MKKIFLTLLFSVLTAHATETIRVIVPYAAGGNTDLVARLYAKELAKREKMRAGWKNDRLKKKAITA